MMIGYLKTRELAWVLTTCRNDCVDWWKFECLGAVGRADAFVPHEISLQGSTHQSVME